MPGPLEEGASGIRVIVMGSTSMLGPNGTIWNSMMQVRKVDKREPLALHEQVAAEIRRAIADGEASPGERLAPAIDLAAVMGVNKNTVIRALHVLRDEGLLDFTRGRGIRVVGTPQRSAVLLKIDELLAFARRQGLHRDEVIQIMESRGSTGLASQ